MHPKHLLIIPLLFLLLLPLPSLADAPLPGSITHPVEEVTSPQRIKAWLLENHNLPIIAIHFAFARSGFAYDPPGKEGMSFLVSGLLNEGAGSYSSHTFKQALEETGTQIEWEVDEDYFYVTIQMLSQNKERALKLLSLALTTPTLDKTAIKRVKEQLRVNIAMKEQDTAFIAAKAWRQAVFSPHRYGLTKEGTASSIDAISQQDIVDYVKASFTQANMTISAVGDITPGQLSLLLDSYFTALPADSARKPSLEAFTMQKKGEYIVIPKAVPQAAVVFGGKGITREDPDFYAAYVLNHILGDSGLESRLMRQVRIRHGLAYSISSQFDTLEQGGVFKGSLATHHARTNEAIALVKAEIERIRTNKVGEEELSDAKNHIMLSFPVKLDRVITLAQFINSMQLKSLGRNYLAERNSYINAVTVEDITRVAKRLLNPEEMVIVTVGGK